MLNLHLHNITIVESRFDALITRDQTTSVGLSAAILDKLRFCQQHKGKNGEKNARKKDPDGFEKIEPAQGLLYFFSG